MQTFSLLFLLSRRLPCHPYAPLSAVPFDPGVATLTAGKGCGGKARKLDDLDPGEGLGLTTHWRRRMIMPS